MIDMRAEAVVDRLLTDAAEALIRKPSRRPNWLPKAFPMKLILTMKRELLVNFICNDRSFRRYLYEQANKRGLGLDLRLLDGLTAENFERTMNQSSDPHRLVTTAFIGPDDDLCAVAAPWVQCQEIIPTPAAPPPPDEVGSPEREASPPPPASTEEVAQDVAAGPEDGAEQPAVDDVPGPASGEGAEPAEEIVAPPPAPTALSPPDPPRPDAGKQPSVLVAALEGEVASLRRRLAKVEAANKDLLSRVPTKVDRRRINKQSGLLKRTQDELERARAQLAELGDERDHLIQIRSTAEEQLDEAIDARTVAEHKSRTLEAQLATTEGRARYLRKSLDNDLAEARSLVEGFEHGRDRTKATRRVETVTALIAALDTAFPPELAPALPRTRRVKNGQMLDLAVTPLGGGEEIGGSAVLVEGGGHRILVDAGLHPDGRGPADIGRLLDDDGPLDAIIVTHAHTDHAGYIPALVSRYPRVPVVCSLPTAQLLPTMWADSAKVMDRLATESAADGAAPAPLYGSAEVEQAEARIQEAAFGRTFPLGGFEITLFVAGHILGAAGVVIAAGRRKVVITGDISGPDDTYLSVEPLGVPHRLAAGADLLVIETTYCHADHTPRTEQESGLVSAVRSTVSRRGRVLIPAFGLGRAQEVVMILRAHLPDVPVLLDGMAKEISHIYEKVAEQRGEEITIIGGQVRKVEHRSRMIETFNAGVIVSTSGMLTGGPSVEWAKAILPNEADALLLCGYQDEEAPGRRLEALADGRGRRQLLLADSRWGEELIDVRADVRKYRLSAHADRRGLLDVIKMVQPKATMLVHGEPHNQRHFRALLRNANLPTVPTARWSSR